MKIKLAVSALMLVLVLLTTSCSNSNWVFNVNVTCEEFEYKSADLENEFEIHKGDQIKVKICVDPDNGYSWDYAIDNEDIVEFESHDYIEPDPTAEDAEPTGIDVWIFKTVKNGEATVVMEYSKPGTPAERTYTMDIMVVEQ